MINTKKSSNSTNKQSSIADNLRTQIKSRIEAMDINIRALERRAKLNVGTVNNILNGASSNPTAETLIALANAFDCTIDNLLCRKTKEAEHSKNELQNYQPFKWSSSIFLSIISELDNQLKNKKQQISADKALQLILEIYLYSLKKNKEAADENLIEWLLEKIL